MNIIELHTEINDLYAELDTAQDIQFGSHANAWQVVELYEFNGMQVVEGFIDISWILRARQDMFS